MHKENQLKVLRQHIILGIAVLLVASQAWSQRSVLAMPDDAGVWVRWTSPDLNNKNGLRVYRQEAAGGEWKLLNETPFTYGQADITTLISSDVNIKNAKVLADGMRKSNKLEGLGLALVLTNAVESREFSNYLGIIYHDKTAAPGTEYRYEVREVTGGSETSYGQSPLVKAGKLQRQPPLTEINTLVKDGKIFFSWNPDQKRLTGAHVYFKIGGGAWMRFNKKIILPSKIGEEGQEKFPEWLFLADSLQYGVTYTCVIKGVDFFGFETEASPEMKLTPVDKTAPGLAGNFDLKVAADKVTVTWDLPNPKGVEGFNIYRVDGNDTVFVKRNKQLLPSNQRKYEETVEETGAAYRYAIATVDKAGNEGRCDARTIMVPDAKPPVAVRNLKAVADTGVIKLTWFPNPEKDLKGYILYRMSRTKNGGDTLQITTSPFASNAYNDTLPKIAKNQFVYFVTAVDTNYNASVFSAPASAVLPDPEPPQAPTIKVIRRQDDGLKVVWLPGMEIDLAGYFVYRSTKERGHDSIWKPLMQRPLGAKDTVYSDRAIEAGQVYYYRVQALDGAGNRSDKSECFAGSVTTMRVKALPQDVEIRHAKGKSEATITWSMPAGADVIGCMVYRKQGKEEFLPISGLMNEYKIVDKSLKKGNTYYYEIRAFDKVGNYSKSAPLTLTIEE